MATIILAGGLGTRMGRDKAHLELDGTTVLQSLVSRFEREMGPVIVALRPGQDVRIEGAMVSYDTYEAAGPLGGLHTGLTASPDEENLILACDMPFANPALARFLVCQLGGYDAVVPVLQAGVEPLHAAYRKSCLPEIEANLEAGRFRMKDLLDRVHVLYVHEHDLRGYDPELRSFVNVNTPEEYRRLLIDRASL